MIDWNKVAENLAHYRNPEFNNNAITQAINLCRRMAAGELVERSEVWELARKVHFEQPTPPDEVDENMRRSMLGTPEQYAADLEREMMESAMNFGRGQGIAEAREQMADVAMSALAQSTCADAVRAATTDALRAANLQPAKPKPCTCGQQTTDPNCQALHCDVYGARHGADLTVLSEVEK